MLARNDLDPREEEKPQERQAELPIESVLKQKYGLYLQKKQLIEELLDLDRDKQVLEPFSYLWGTGGKRLRVIAGTSPIIQPCSSATFLGKSCLTM